MAESLEHTAYEHSFHNLIKEQISLYFYIKPIQIGFSGVSLTGERRWGGGGGGAENTCASVLQIH